MELKQITVSIENSPGRPLEVTEAPAAAGINLRVLNLVDEGILESFGFWFQMFGRSDGLR